MRRTLSVSALQPLACMILGATLLEAAGCTAAIEAPTAAPPALLATYDRLLPLAGGSNFRDAGGYSTADGRAVRRGVIYRSGAMTSLTKSDQEFLKPFGFRRVVDLRSAEERTLFPNHWAGSSGVALVAHDYSIRELMARMAPGIDADESTPAMPALYRELPFLLEPQLRIFFDELLAGHTPLVVNCSAGQDRTGISVALLLLALGVPRDEVIEDYLLSTRYRNPVAERGGVDLEAAAEHNFFAEVMLRHGPRDDQTLRAEPLLTENGVPYLRFALTAIEQDFGSIEAFLQERIGLDREAVARLQALYLVAPGS